jgi:uncharacterized protein (DUF58 family)
MRTAEEYLKPEVIQQIRRLDLRAKLVVRGFLQGLHASPYQGFSVQFSEHRRYARGDDPKAIDWLVYAKTDKYYVKRFEAETNLTGYLVMDLSQSMGFTFRQQLTKFDYTICLAASLCYLMLMQQDPVGLVTIGTKLRAELPARSRRSQLSQLLARLAKLQPTGATGMAEGLRQLPSLLKHRSLLMIFSDLLTEIPPVMKALARLRHAGHDIILFHILDEAEVAFPYQGSYEFEDPETGESIVVDSAAYRESYVNELEAFRAELRDGCNRLRVDYVPLDTSQQFDKALTEYLLNRRNRF